MNIEGLYTREKVENMNTVEIIKYMNDNFGGLNNFYVYARIVEITDENIVTIPDLYHHYTPPVLPKLPLPQVVKKEYWRTILKLHDG